ncbi:unnamed protein product [Rotaria sordida]|uniref:Uncharacterized protein n=1 Tax=Rotaria sordida TaxID=392033 RepID=A0A815R3N9_9BILA|nr:unnamed protein product [Rotaria sordida]CAF1645094.1 unnamed protein product [Rotaria sordida]
MNRFLLDSILSKIEDHLICSFCHYVLIEPKKISCGHRYCFSCLEKVKKTKQPSICVVNDCGQIIMNDEICFDFDIVNDLVHLRNIACLNQSHGCLWIGNYLSYTIHLQMCTFEHFQCQYCSISFTDRLLYKQHYRTCRKALVSCPYKKFGCNVEIHQEALDYHILMSSVKHLQLVNNFISSFENQSLTTCLQSLSTFSHITSTTENSNIQLLEKEVVEQAKIIEELHLEEKFLHSNNNKFEQITRNLYERFNVESSEDELNETRKEHALSSLFNSNNKTYLWYIDHIEELLKNTKQPSEPLCITSPSFNSSIYDYKVILKLYLNSDQIAENTHLSLDVIVMCDNNDSLIKWPFYYEIILCLFDTSCKNEHVIHILTTPDIDNQFNQKSQKNENLNFTISKFCPLWKLFHKEFGYSDHDALSIMALVNIDFDKIAIRQSDN